MTDDDTEALLALLGGLALQGERLRKEMEPKQLALARIVGRLDALSRALMAAHPDRHLWIDAEAGAAGLDVIDDGGL